MRASLPLVAAGVTFVYEVDANITDPAGVPPIADMCLPYSLSQLCT